MYQFREKPYCNSGDYYIFPLNSLGVEKYNSKEGHPALYLNRLNPTIFQQIVSTSSDSKETQNGNQMAQNSKTMLDGPIRSQQNDENNKSKDIINGNNKAIKDSNNDIRHQVNSNQYRKITVTSKSNKDIMPFEQPLKQQRMYFNTLHKRKDFEDIFGYPQPVKKKTKKDMYECEIDMLKKNLSTIDTNDNKLGIKFVNGGIPMPRINRLNEGKKVSHPFNALTKQLNGSLSIPHSNMLNDNENYNVLQKNDDLKAKLNQQTNKIFLLKTKLPPLTKVLSTKQVISKSIGNTKYLGPKYYPYSFTNNSYGRYARNYIGGKYSH